MYKKYDRIIAFVFAVASVVLLISLIVNRELLDWAFARHHNQLSWFIRPVFIIPFCYFAYKRSSAGISITVFAIFTSMFWFPEPSSVSPQVKAFLQYEVDYLTGDWSILKILMTLIVPLSMITLALAFWKRNIWFGFSVMAFIAFGKIGWSILFAGESGKTTILPAMIGLVACFLLLYMGFRKTQKNRPHP